MGNIADKLTHLNDTKLLLRDAISRAGHYLPDSATFRSYPYAMLPDEASLNMDFVRGEYVAHNWRDGTVSRVGLSNIVGFTRGSGGGRFNHLGVFEWVGNNIPRIDHDPATLSTSTSSVTLASGAVTLDVTVTYPVGAYVRATADASNWMAGRVTASTGTSVTLWVDRVVGSGTFASWTVIRVLGLVVEESRTNLLTYSAQFDNVAWAPQNSSAVANQAASPDGLISAYLLRENSATTQHYISQSRTTTAGTSYTHTVFAKPAGRSVVQLSAFGGQVSGDPHANFDLVNLTVSTVGSITASITAVGGGWARCSITVTAAGASLGVGIVLQQSASAGRFAAYTGDGTSGIYIWGAQLEAGSFPTSHIPTASSQVTRAADVATVGDLSDWYRADEGALFAEFQTFATSGLPTVLELLGDIRVWANTANSNIALNGRGSSSWAVVNSTPLQALKKYAMSYSSAGASACVNGGAVVTATRSVTMPATRLQLGWGSGVYINGHIEQIAFIPRALSNTELQRLTS